jgi:hypothetical protein
MRKVFTLMLLMSLALLSACRRDQPLPAAVTAVPDTATKSAIVTTTSRPPTAPAAAEPTSIPTPARDAPNNTAPTLLDYAWDDREPFRSGLIPGQEDVLHDLPGATVYQIALDISDPNLVQGQMAARYTNQETEALNELVLHLFPGMLGGDISVTDVRVEGTSVAAQTGEHVLRVPLAAPLQPGEQVVLSLAFTTVVPGDEGTKYNVLAYVDGTLALAHFYPMFAVYDDTGWHTEPSAPHGDETFGDSSFYLVDIIAPAAQTIATSGIEIARQEDGEQQRVTVAAGPMRDFYLAANPEYDVVTAAVGPVRVNSYAPANRMDGAELALDTAVQAMTSYSQRFGAYPFAELDIVTTPTRALGIEYPGIFANAERIYDLSAASGNGTPNEVLLQSTTAHETAHQWFYSLVGSDQLNEPWLDESLTQYATYLYYVDRYGEADAEGFLENLHGRWNNAQNRDLPIGLPAGAYSGQDYGAIVYGRGPLFVKELADTMGQERFDAFLHEYNQTYRYQIATAVDFKALAEAACDCDLSPLFAQWVDAQ